MRRTIEPAYWRGVLFAVVLVNCTQGASLTVPFYSQQNSHWSSKALGGSSVTIGTHGCALTATSMVVSYFGVATDPNRLNDELGAIGAIPDGNLDWPRVPEVCAGRVTQVDRVYDPDLSKIAAELNEGYPVIAHVRTPADADHYVVFWGNDGSVYSFYDPADKEPTPRQWPYGYHGEYSFGKSLRIYRGILILPDSIQSDRTLRAFGCPYIVRSDVTVEEGRVLRIDPGVVVKFDACCSLYVKGNLIAAGTPGNEVFLTSLNDDSDGHDTNGGTTSPAARDWGHVSFANTCTGSTLDHVVVRYAGREWSFPLWSGVPAIYTASSNLVVDGCTLCDNGDSAIRIDGSNPLIKDNSIAGNGRDGVEVSNGSPTIEGNFITKSAGCGIVVRGSSKPTIRANRIGENTGWAVGVDPSCSGMSVQGNELFGAGAGILVGAGTLATNVIWGSDSVYVIDYGGAVRGLTINENTTLTVDPGVVVKFEESAELVVRGALIANGTPDRKVVFTSLRDDSYGGDTNGDGSSSSPAANDWGTLAFFATCTASTLDYTVVKYAGRTWSSPMWISEPAVICETSDLVVTNSELAENGNDGISVRAGSPIISANSITGNGRHGIDLHGGAPLISRNVIAENPVGLGHAATSGGLVYLNDFLGNGHHAIGTGSGPSWQSAQEIPYTYAGKAYTSHLGNYWDSYTGVDAGGDGIGDTPHMIADGRDDYPLMLPFENYGVGEELPDPPPSPGGEAHIDGISPDDGAPGIMATISGRNLNRATKHVRFGSVEAEIVSWSETTVVVTVPEPRSAGERTVNVTAGGGIGLEETNSVSFTYKKPVLESIRPSYGKPADEITFTGEYFGEVQHSVEFGRSLVSPESHNNTRIVAKAPWDLGTGVEEWIFIKLVKGVLSPIPYSGVLVDMVYDLEAGGVVIDRAGGDIDVEARARSAIGRSDPKRFTFNIYEVIEMVIGSPGEPRIVDAEGNVTGVVDGNVRREIPYSYYADDTALVVNPESSYTFEVVGTGQGTYGLRISRINRDSPQQFEANGMLIGPGSRHVFEINWGSGTPSTTLKVDTEGDGRFEQTITTSDSLESPQISVNSLVGVAAGAASYDRRTGQFSVGVTVKNTSSAVIGEPVWLVIDSVSSFWVVPANTDGTTEDGKAYMDLSPLLTGGNLGPGETVQTRVYFNNPQRARFTFEPGVRGVVSP